MKKLHLLITAALLTTSSVSVMAANDNPYSGRTFGGALISNSDWTGMSTSEIPYGMHTFQIGGTTYTPVITDHDYGFMAAAYGNGTLIGIREASFMGVLSGVFNYDLSLDDPTKRKVTLIDGQELSYAALSSVMTYSPIDNVYYSVNYNSDLTGLTWNRYNRKIQRFETIAIWPNRFQPLALAVGNDNTIYCIGKDGYLYTLNSETGAASMVGELGVTPALNSQSACYDGKTNTLLWAAMADVNGFYSVDVETGAATLISEFGKQEQFAAIFPMEYTAQPEAPANPAELKIVYDADGSLSGKITFTAPSTLQNGNALTGNVTVLTYVDGVKKDSRSVAAGSNVEVPVELSNDNHYVAVYAKSKGKCSAPVSFNTYSGYDTPLAPTDAIFTCNEGNASLSWTAPTAGVNNGYINSNALTFNIIRMPEGVSVANGLTATEFSETLPDEMRRYYYKVTACNGSSDKESEPAISNYAVWGLAYPVPFGSTFDTQEIADTYTVADKNEDGKTWGYNSYNHNMGIDTYQVANSNDWLISPAISMEKGMLYEMSAFVHTYGRNYPENFRLLVGTNPADVNSFKQFAEFTDFVNYDGYAKASGEFSVEADGKYYVAIQAFGKGSSLIHVNKITVDLVAGTNAPQAVTGVSINSDAGNITVKFTAPVSNLDGTPINSLESIVVKRDGKLLSTVSAPEPGKEVTVNAAVGSPAFSDFDIYAVNGGNEGKHYSVRQFVGEYSAPYSEDFTNPDYVSLYTTEIVGNPGEYEWKVWGQDGLVKTDFMSVEVPIDLYVYSPSLRLDAESVYEISLDWIAQGNYENSLTFGKSAESASQTEVATLPCVESYGDEPLQAQNASLVTSEDGLYNFGFKTHITTGFQFVNNRFDNIKLRYVGSAFAPSAVTDLKTTADAEGNLKNTISFNAPATDYSGRELQSLTRIDIYRGTDSAIPVKTFEAPAVGEALEWTDENAVYGNNEYVVVASNDKGRGSIAVVKNFVGEDVPTKVNNLSCESSDDNMSVKLSWEAPEFGVNGGVVNKANVSYIIVEYFPKTGEFVQIATEVTDTHYEGEPIDTEEQTDKYYGVVAVNGAGAGALNLQGIVLGKPLGIPFAESFANGETSTRLWNVLDPTDECSWSETPVEGTIFTCGAQDNDNGLAVMFNSTNYNVPYTRTLVSPLISLEGMLDATLSLWYYGGIESYYDAPATLGLKISTDTKTYQSLLENVIDLTKGRNPQWKKVEVDLAPYLGQKKIIIAFVGTSSGYQEPVLIDNIRIDGTSGVVSVMAGDIRTFAGKGIITVLGADGKDISIFSLDGSVVAERRVASQAETFSVAPGIYVVKAAGESCKILVKE